MCSVMHFLDYKIKNGERTTQPLRTPECDQWTVEAWGTLRLPE
jgi:hypothetical protein